MCKLLDKNYDGEKYLESMVGEVMLDISDKKELIEIMNVTINGELLSSLNVLNSALEEDEVNYRIMEFETSKITNGKRKLYRDAWKVVRLSDE